MRLMVGDCIDEMKKLPSDSIDSIVTDPPYGLSFMGKTWDYDVPAKEMWVEALRVLKPGGHLISFGGSRTYHRMAVAIEDAGFEIRDQIMWIYGTGFPKSHNGPWGSTALKPAHEPCVLARKPFPTTVAENFAEHGVGGLNIDGSRVGSRWPANVILDEEAATVLDEQTGDLSPGNRPAVRNTNSVFTAHAQGETGHSEKLEGGGASRFFYCAKPGRAEREAGLEDHDENVTNDGRKKGIDNAYQRGMTLRKNVHPTVKPVDLMRYMCRLITPPGGVVLDPFMGSGTTGIAAVQEGFGFVGIEREPDYAEIAAARIAHWGNADLTELEDGSVELDLPPETEWL